MSTGQWDFLLPALAKRKRHLSSIWIRTGKWHLSMRKSSIILRLNGFRYIRSALRRLPVRSVSFRQRCLLLILVHGPLIWCRSSIKVRMNRFVWQRTPVLLPVSNRLIRNVSESLIQRWMSMTFNRSCSMEQTTCRISTRTLFWKNFTSIVRRSQIISESLVTTWIWHRSSLWAVVQR